MKKIIIGMLVMTVSLFLLLSYFVEDVQINKYKDMATVQEEKTIEHGWIPGILPKSAYDIVETHNIDTNTVFGTFKYKEQDEVSFMQHLTGLNDDNQTMLWGGFLFRVNKEENYVKFRNKTNKGQ